MIDVDFSLAIHNRTGKYFIGRDIINDNSSIIDSIFYGRLNRPSTPGYLAGRLASRVMMMEMKRRVAGRISLPLIRRVNPVLHMDPLTALNYIISPRDMIIVHDVGPITHPDLFPADVTALYKAAYDYISEHRPMLIFVSKASQSAFNALYRFSGETCVIYPHIRSDLKNIADPVPDVSTPFLLTVGSIGARKGQEASIAAYARSGLHDRGVSYVICGGPEEPGYTAVVTAVTATPGVVHLPYVSDAQLSWLYRHAAGFVLASRLEGFGVPVAEAISYGLIPAVTAASVLEEVAGPEAVIFDAYDENAIAQAMIKLTEMSEGERTRRSADLTRHIARFSPKLFADHWRALLSNKA